MDCSNSDFALNIYIDKCNRLAAKRTKTCSFIQLLVCHQCLDLPTYRRGTVVLCFVVENGDRYVSHGRVSSSLVSRLICCVICVLG